MKHLLPSTLLLLLALPRLPALATDPLDLGTTGLTLVRLSEPAAARTFAGLHPEARFDPTLPAARLELDRVDRLHTQALDALTQALGRPVEPVFRYRTVYNGFALRLSPPEAEAVAALPGVAAVRPDTLHPLTTDAGPTWVGAPGIWDGSATGSLPGTKGEGVIVGILDTGINMDHPSFADDPPDGHTFTNPFGTGVFVGWCDPAHPNFDPAYVCNDKLVGGWDYVDALSDEDDGPEDGNFHGSHMAGIAVGNTLTAPALSGMAPHANVIVYDVCYTVTFGVEECPESAIIAAIDQAVLDGVDVLNLSIAGGLDPWNDVDAALLDAVAAEVVAVASGGNEGPGAGTVEHRGPWVTSLGATTHDRVANENMLAAMTGGDTTPPGDLTGQSLTVGYGPAPITHPGDCSAPFAPGTWTNGEIVVCDQINPVFVWSYCQNAAGGGAGGCVIANEAGPFESSIQAEFHGVPATHLDLASADTLRLWLASGTGHQATLTASAQVLDSGSADVVQSFSSRGPNPGIDVLKPNLVAPGWAILSAVGSATLPSFSGDEYLHVSGTSQSAAFGSGASALLRALHPTWSPAEVRSALMTTAFEPLTVVGGGAATALDAGSGRLDLTKAARVGLLLDETASAYAAADPALGGGPATLNESSFVASACQVGCSWTRTVETAVATTVDWTASATGPPGWIVEVTPALFTLSVATPTQSIEVTVTPDPASTLGPWYFGEVTLSPNEPSIPDARLPVAVYYLSIIFQDGFESGDTSAWSATVP